jgi:hypothetical protein
MENLPGSERSTPWIEEIKNGTEPFSVCIARPSITVTSNSLALYVGTMALCSRDSVSIRPSYQEQSCKDNQEEVSIRQGCARA